MVEVYRDDSKICTAIEASSFFERASGLMFKGSLKDGEGMLINFSHTLKSRRIHSFFMRFAIDLIFIDSNMKVADLATLKPWKTYNPKKDCKWVLEVNTKTIEKNKIKIGDVLTFA